MNDETTSRHLTPYSVETTTPISESSTCKPSPELEVFVQYDTHYHTGPDRRCARCGEDLASDIHVRSNETKEEAKQRVLAAYPGATEMPDASGAPSADSCIVRPATKEDWPENKYVAVGPYVSDDPWLAAAELLGKVQSKSNPHPSGIEHVHERSKDWKLLFTEVWNAFEHAGHDVYVSDITKITDLCTQFIAQNASSVQPWNVDEIAKELTMNLINRVREKHQEVGGVMLTLAALCNAQALDMNRAATDELARAWSNIEKIREKQAKKPKHSPLAEQPASPSLLKELVEALEEIEWAVYSDPDYGKTVFCSSCRADKKYGHQEGCKVGAVLAKAKKEIGQ